MYGNGTFSIILLSTKKRYSSWKRFLFFQRTCFEVKVLKMLKISSDCHVKMCWSLKNLGVMSCQLIFLFLILFELNFVLLGKFCISINFAILFANLHPLISPLRESDFPNFNFVFPLSIYDLLTLVVLAENLKDPYFSLCIINNKK